MSELSGVQVINGAQLVGASFPANAGTATTGTVLSGTVDPSAGAGIAAPLGSLYFRGTGGVGTVYQKTAAADTAWSVVPVGSPQAVHYRVTSGDITSLSITGLDGDNDGLYVLYYNLISGPGGAMQLLLRPNGDAPALDQSSSRVELSTGALSTTADLQFCDVAAAAPGGVCRTGMLILDPRTQPAINTDGRRMTSLGTDEYYNLLWTNVADNITSLDILSSIASGIGELSQFTLVKMPLGTVIEV